MKIWVLFSFQFFPWDLTKLLLGFKMVAVCSKRPVVFTTERELFGLISECCRDRSIPRMCGNNI